MTEPAPIPTVIVYACQDDCPEGVRFMARFLQGKNVLPIIFHAGSADLAKLKAEEWWLEQQRIAITKKRVIALLIQSRKERKARP